MDGDRDHFEEYYTKIFLRQHYQLIPHLIPMIEGKLLALTISRAVQIGTAVNKVLFY